MITVIFRTLICVINGRQGNVLSIGYLIRYMGMRLPSLAYLIDWRHLRIVSFTLYLTMEKVRIALMVINHASLRQLNMTAHLLLWRYKLLTER